MILKTPVYLTAFPLLFVLFLCTCGPAQDLPAMEQAPIAEVEKSVVLDGLRRPWSMAFLAEDEALVTEKDGDLLHVNLRTGATLAITGLPVDIADSLLIDTLTLPEGTAFPSAHGARMKFNAGLFDVCLDPSFADNGLIYLSYAAQRNATEYGLKVIRGKLEGEALVNVDTLLSVGPFSPVLFHFGGGLVFGSDGKLYITAGERLLWDALQPPLPIAQNLRDQRGKIYRLNPDGSVPDDNPDFGDGAVSGLYAAGIRAAQGLARHPETGDIWFSEHGTKQGDELNLLRAGANYGWPVRSTGGYRGGYEPPQLKRDFTPPVWFWHHTVAPTGLAWYFGDEFPHWHGDLLVPGLSKGSLWRIRIKETTIQSVEELLMDNRHRTRKVAVSPGGKIYLLTDEANGKIIRLQPGA